MALKVGIDFDNTLADYSGVFYQVGVELDWIPKHTLTTKTDVKAYFFNQGLPEQWTELQGIVYGSEIYRTQVYVGAKEVIEQLLEKNVELYIISHKTKFPVIGEKISLHQAALTWLHESALIGSGAGMIPEKNIFFNETKEEKISKIAALNCDFFIDDLPSIFLDKSFPSGVKKIFFDPDEHYKNVDFAHFKESSWAGVGLILNA